MEHRLNIQIEFLSNPVWFDWFSFSSFEAKDRLDFCECVFECIFFLFVFEITNKLQLIPWWLPKSFHLLMKHLKLIFQASPPPSLLFSRFFYDCFIWVHFLPYFSFEFRLLNETLYLCQLLEPKPPSAWSQVVCMKKQTFFLLCAAIYSSVSMVTALKLSVL